MFLTVENSRPKDRKAIRSRCPSAKSQTPIKVVDGEQAPTCRGEDGYHTFRAKKGLEGGVCNNPGAARRAGYKTDYHRSTKEITVGAAWVIDNVPGCLEYVAFGPARRGKVCA